MLDESKRCATGYIVDAHVNNGVNKLDATQNYYTWDFGYTCYMPQTVYIENFESGAEKTFIFNDVRDEHFCKEDKSREYRRTKQIILKDCTREMPICQNKESVCGMLAAVPVKMI